MLESYKIVILYYYQKQPLAMNIGIPDEIWFDDGQPNSIS